MADAPSSRSRLGVIVLLRMLLFTGLHGALLMVAAGTVRWPMGWALLATWFGPAFLVVPFAVRHRPDLLEERMHPKDNAKSWDKPFVIAIAVVGPPVVLLVCGLDHRLGWTGPVVPALAAAGLVAILVGNALMYWAVAANRFFSSTVRIQADRGHTVATGGPYRMVRHPGYVGGIVMHLGTPVALGSAVALVPALVIIVLLFVRTAREDRTLQRELDGYVAYAARVRYRLLPGLW